MTVVRRSPVRTLLLAALVSAAGLVPTATMASAAVSITPDRAVPGDSVDVTFRVTNDRPGTTTTKVSVELPVEAPVAEVYPMSVAGWAPSSTTRTADRPLKGIHSADVTSITSAITWVRADDAPPQAPVEELRMEMGPVPEVGRIAFAVVQTYSDGVVRRWEGPAAGTVLTVAPAAGSGSAGSGSGAAGSGSSAAPADPGGMAGMAGMDMGAGAAPEGAAAGGPVAGSPAAGGAAVATTGVSTGNGMIDILAGILGGVLVTLVAGALITSRIRKDAARESVPDTIEDDETPAKELARADAR